MRNVCWCMHFCWRSDYLWNPITRRAYLLTDFSCPSCHFPKIPAEVSLWLVRHFAPILNLKMNLLQLCFSDARIRILKYTTQLCGLFNNATDPFPPPFFDRLAVQTHGKLPKLTWRIITIFIPTQNFDLSCQNYPFCRLSPRVCFAFE